MYQTAPPARHASALWDQREMGHGSDVEGVFCRPYIPTRQTGGGADEAASIEDKMRSENSKSGGGKLPFYRIRRVRLKSRLGKRFCTALRKLEVNLYRGLH
jgi:hypothetical protein